MMFQALTDDFNLKKIYTYGYCLENEFFTDFQRISIVESVKKN